MTEPMTDAPHRPIDVQSILDRLRRIEPHTATRRTVTLEPHEATAILDHIGARAEHCAAMEARVSAEGDRADAAEARALPEPRLLRTVEEVEALPEGKYFIHNEDQNTVVLDRFPSFAGSLMWLQLGIQGCWRDPEWIVGRLIAGPYPDLPTPTAAQEG